MELPENSVIIDDKLDRMLDPERTEQREPSSSLEWPSRDGRRQSQLVIHFTHAYCEAGQCEVTFNGQTFTLNEGGCMIIIANRLVSRVLPSSDFKVKVIYVEESFLQACTPHSNYGTRGGLSLYINPIMRMTDDERLRVGEQSSGMREICRRGFENVFLSHGASTSILPRRRDDGGPAATVHRLLRVSCTHRGRGGDLYTGGSGDERLHRDAGAW